jgi:gamma-glutamyltranspeptidase/glutathione hydrolase
VLLQALQILDGFDLAVLGHNTPDYVHTVTEAIKLSCADRERYYGDPKFVEVPIEWLLSEGYAAERRALIRNDVAFPELPAPGAMSGAAPSPLKASVGAAGVALDTSYACAVDRQGNVFSATPSDVAHDTPVIPGTGLSVSSRGAQSWAVAGHASAVAPGKRPRLTPNPALALGPEGLQMPFGTPGGDVQSQAMLQVLLNHRVFGMDIQQAVEAPRFASLSFPNSFEPHAYLPGRLQIEGRIPEATADDLAGRGHDVAMWEDWTWLAGSMCAIVKDRRSGFFSAGADPRRPAYALGW